MTLEQLARFLQTSEEAVAALADLGQLPGRRIGEEWRFSRAAVLAWLEGER
jgi:excisionase family DNA binding protein